MTCQKDHRYDTSYNRLPKDQGDFARHKCAGCAYEVGFDLGLRRVMNVDMEHHLSPLMISQAAAVRHKSPYVAFAQGYSDGLFKSTPQQ